jgi:hypothetical protein
MINSEQVWRDLSGMADYYFFIDRCFPRSGTSQLLNYHPRCLPPPAVVLKIRFDSENSQRLKATTQRFYLQP